MKRVLFLYHTSAVGGGSYCLLNILKNLDRHSVEPHVLLSEDGPLVAEIEKLGIEVNFLKGMHTVPYNVSTLKPSKLKNAISIIKSMRFLKHFISESKPDVVYCNTMMLYPYLRPSKECGCKTIIHIREHWPEGEHSWQRKTAFEHIAKYADEIIAINRYSASMVVPYGRKATIVYDWIDMGIRYQEMPLSDIFNEDMSNKKTFLYMGGLQEIKGAYEVLLAFSKHLTDPDNRLLVLGINPMFRTVGIRGLVKRILRSFGKTQYSDKVLELINSDPRIKCIPGVYNIRHLYEQAYCIVSYFTIPHANLSLAEAVICHTMNVAARTDESVEYSNEGEMALLYRENDFNDFVTKLNALSETRATYMDRMEKHSDVIKDMFAPSPNINRLNKIINSI